MNLMADLLLRFAIQLENYELQDRHAGPLCHEWLPDGEKDAVSIENKEEAATLQLWFERRGFVESGMIRFHHCRSEVNPEIISRQAVLDAGPLRGLLKLEELGEEVLTLIREGLRGDDHYVALGKRVVKKLLEPHVSRFLRILSTNFGQYWISDRLVEWDSREQSLGRYCDLINLAWSLDGGQTWSPFIPNEPERAPVIIKLGRLRFDELITEEDWADLSKAFREDYNPTLAAVILGRAHELLDQGHVRSDISQIKMKFPNT
jgi:hypothetical protein